MYLNSINFPNEIIDAIKNNKLVVFAGAGASMGKPTCLPDFDELAESVAYGTGEVLNRNKESAEVFLGKLKYRGIDVNGRAAKQLSNECLQPNDMHRAIIDLFCDAKGIKIVTTNYDHMFEAVFEERDSKEGYMSLPIYDVPALPLGNDVSGIIHLHGNISNPKYMVLTDEDFGKAYLTEGYASRFLVQLFNEYTILFIGYSYNDIILRYLTRAMSRNVAQKKFIMTHEDENAWEALGIKAIKFPTCNLDGKTVGDYDAERLGLLELGRRIKRGLHDWKYQFSAVALSPQKDLTGDSEIDYCLSKYETAKIIADCVQGKEWLKCLDSKGTFDKLFNANAELEDKDRLWAEWLIKWFLTDEEGMIINLFSKKNRGINSVFSNMIIRELSINDLEISPNLFSQYIFLFGNEIEDHYFIFRLASKCKKKGWNDMLVRFFLHMLDFSIVTTKNYWHDGFEFNHVLRGEYYDIERTWKENKDVFLGNYAYYIMTAVQRKIKEIAHTYITMGMNEPWGMANLPIEEKDPGLVEECFVIFCNIIEECSAVIEKKDVKAIRLFIIDSLESESILLKRLALKLLRESGVIKESEKIEIAFRRVPLSLTGAREQMQKLIKKSYLSTGERGKKLLYRKIDACISEDNSDRSQRRVYNWYVWLQKFDKKNEIIQGKIDRIKEEHPDYEPYIDFERSDIEDQDFDCNDEAQSVKTEDELLEMNPEDVLSMLKANDKDIFGYSTKYKLLETISNTCKKNYEWSDRLVLYLIKNESDEKEVWEYVFRGLQTSDFSIDEDMHIITVLTEDISKFESKIEIAEYLWKTINIEGFKDYYCKNKKRVFDILDCIWNERETATVIGDNIYFYCLNSTLGNILNCYVRLLSFDSADSIPDVFKTRFEECLGLDGDDRRVSICILTGYYMFLSYLDKEWCFDKLIPYLESSDDQEYADAWGGVVYLSRRMNIDRVKELEGTYLKAIKKIKKLPKEIKGEFVSMYTTIVVSIVDDPIETFIPVFLRNSDAESKRRFALGINHRLMNMQDESKKNIWERWLRIYYENRNNGIPIKLTNDDRLQMLDWIVELEPVFDEAVEIICKGEPPKKINSSFLYSFLDKEMAEKHPEATVKLLIFLLNDKSSIECSGSYVQKICESLPLELRKGNNQLEEALLRCGFSFNL